MPMKIAMKNNANVCVMMTVMCLALGLVVVQVDGVVQNLQIQSDLGRVANVFDIVKNGVAETNWVLGNTTNSFTTDDPGFQFFLLLTGSGENHTITIDPLITPSKILDVSLEYPQYAVSGGDLSANEVQFYCVGNGTVTVALSFIVDTRIEDIVTIYFKKTCLVYSDQMESGFCASLSDDGIATVVVNGTTMFDWFYLADTTQASDVFYFWTDTPQRPFLGYGLISFYMYDPDVITPIADPPKSRAFPHIKGVRSSHMTVTYNCNPNGGKSDITMALTLNGAFDDVYITWTKTCPVAQPAPDNGGTGWTPAGIFFFTVFIVTLTGCMGGCIYNYLARRKTGWDVVPCIDVYRRCWASMCNSKSSVPESSSYAPVSDSTYGATSSSSYQSAHHNDL